MAISVDRVYQKVLAFANKEQRGYITPQDFNLFAHQAQMEIFEQYFYDLNQWTRQHGNSSAYADMIRILEEKISKFEMWAAVDNITVLNKWGDVNLKADLPDMYRLSDVRVKYPGSGYVVAEELSTRDYNLQKKSSLYKPTRDRPVYIRYSYGYDRIKIFPKPVDDDGSDFDLSTQDVIEDFIEVVSIVHPVNAGDGRYFYFDESKMNKLLGAEYHSGDVINITVTRGVNNTIIHGNKEVVIWEKTSANSQGGFGHGRDNIGASRPSNIGDFQVGDKIFIKKIRSVYKGDKRNVRADYIREPVTPNWNYMVVNEKAFYNTSSSVDFELHPAEESELVYRVLAYAGIAIEKPQLTQVAAGIEQVKVQQEKQ